MRVLLVANPAGTRVRTRVREAVAERISRVHDLTVAETTHRGHATSLVREAVAARVDAIAVLGGDGTINEAVNGLDGSKTPLGLLGGGKTNVLARALGLPSEPVAATGRFLELAALGGRRAITLGEADGRRFAFAAGLGWEGAAVREVERWRARLGVHDDGTYLLAGLQSLVSRAYRRPGLVVHTADGPPVRGFFALASNGDTYSYLGDRAFRPTPYADFEGDLDVLVGQTMSPWVIARAIAEALSTTPAGEHERFPVLHDRSWYGLESRKPLPLQLDGEYVGDRTAVELRSHQHALVVVAPPGGSAPPRYPDEPSQEDRWPQRETPPAPGPREQGPEA